MIRSMTGFARTSGTVGAMRFDLEIKSVNAKGLEPRLKVPAGFDGLDVKIRSLLKKRLSRGTLFLTLSLQTADLGPGLRVDTLWLDQLAQIAGELSDRHDSIAPPRADGLMALRGVIETTIDAPPEGEREAVEAALLRAADAAIDQLISEREREGEALGGAMVKLLDEARTLIVACEGRAVERSETLGARLQALLARLDGHETPVSEDRLAQEIALLLVKGDIREEIDRLDSHLKRAMTYINDNKPVGRELDFLCQEMNREANTICSKAQDQALTELGMRLKVIIDQLREQVQNIE